MIGKKTVSIIAVDACNNPDLQFISDSLQALRWKITLIKHVPHCTQLIADAIEESIKRNQISILIGECGDQVVQSLSKVFHQELVKLAPTLPPFPMYARILDRPFNTVIYIQDLIIIPFPSNIEAAFKLGIKPLLNCRSVTAMCNNNGIKIQNGIRCQLDFAVSDSVYEFACYEHVRKSIEDIEKCFMEYQPENVFISFNGGKDCTVILHMTLAVLKRHYPTYTEKPLCLYIENVNSFEELNNFVYECEDYYKLNIIKITKNAKDALADVLSSRPHLKACLMGTRRTDPFSQTLQIFQMTDPDWPQVMRVCPLLDWHYSQIWDYLLTLKVPYCKLYDAGYTSIGNVNNTIRNPQLCIEEHGKESYLPAYKLLEASQERLGRRGSLKKVENDCIRSF